MTPVLFDYWRSTASYRVRIALHLAGQAFDRVPIDLLQSEQTKADHLSRNPQGLVPVLEIDGQRLTQSLAILEYLNTSRALGLLPQDPASAAKVRALAHSLAIDVHPVCNLSVVRHVARSTDNPQQTKKDWMAHFVRPGLVAFETLLTDFAQSSFCCGDTPSLADICLIPQLYNAQRWDVQTSDLKRISAVQDACSRHPAFAAAHPDRVRPLA